MGPNYGFQARVEAAEATTEDDRALPSPSPAKRPKEYGASQTPDAAAASLSTAAERPLDCAAENSVILRVKHECFGLARGTMSADDYAAPNSKCIKCSECGEFGAYPHLRHMRIMGLLVNFLECPENGKMLT